jgi:hypothetical protein
MRGHFNEIIILLFCMIRKILFCIIGEKGRPENTEKPLISGVKKSLISGVKCCDKSSS